MIDKLYSLKKYLNTLSLNKESKLLNFLIKESYLNNATIEYDDSDPDVIRVHLTTVFEGEKKYIATVFAQKLKQNIGGKLVKELKDKSINPTGWWHIHSGFDYKNYAFKGLGYGSDLYMVLLKYITQIGGVIISAPIEGSIVSDDALKLRKLLKNKPGVSSVDIALTSSSYFINIESLKSLSEDDKNRLRSDDWSPNQSAINYRTEDEVTDLEDKENAFIREIEKDFRDPDYYEKLDDFMLNSPNTYIPLSQGAVYWASGNLPISLPVKRVDSKKEFRNITDEGTSDLRKKRDRWRERRNRVYKYRYPDKQSY